MRYLNVAVKSSVAPAALIGLLVGLELAGSNYMWQSARNLSLLLLWSTALLALAGVSVGCVVAGIAKAARLRTGPVVFLAVAVITAVLIFIDRFGWCYPCHQFFDRRSPHLVYTPAKSLMLTIGLALGCAALGAVIGAGCHAVWRSWYRRGVRPAVYCALGAVVSIASITSYMATPSFDEPAPSSTPVAAESVGGVENLLIIIDEALTWDVIDPLIMEGKLPTFRMLVDQGVRAKLATLTPTLSHPLWTTVATGRNPARHGIGSKINYAYPGMTRGIATFPAPDRLMLPYAFIMFSDLGFGHSYPLGPQERRVKAIWNIASDCEVDVGIVGWRCTWPAEKVRGFMVSNRLHDAHITHHVFPDDLTESVAGIISAMPPVSVDGLLSCPRESLVNDERTRGRIASLERLLMNDLRYQAVAEYLFPTRKPSLMALGFLSMDGIGHEFYYEHSLLRHSDVYKLDSYLERFTSYDIVRCAGKVIENAYAFHDSLIEFWVNSLGDESAIIIASDHGFEMDGSNHYYAAPGILILYGAPFRKGITVSAATVFDIAPLALYLLGLPVPLDTEGRLLEDAIDPAWLSSNPVRTIATYETVAD